MILSFCPKFAGVIEAMPAATIGGVSIILYGMISAIGIRNMVENKTDFQQSRNVIIAALIIGLAIGINFSTALGCVYEGSTTIAGGISFAIGSMDIKLSGLAVASIVGILLNAILPGRDKGFGENPDETLASSLGKY